MLLSVRRDDQGSYSLRPGRLAAAWCLLSLAIWCAGCITEVIEPPVRVAARSFTTVNMELTGYCNCGACCNWRRTWFGLGAPVIASGSHAGEPKHVGLTSQGNEASHGTIAADTTRYPCGTIVYIPGYGYGRVEDTGGAITGDHMDLWFETHDEALRWGRQRKPVTVWLPSVGR